MRLTTLWTRNPQKLCYTEIIFFVTSTDLSHYFGLQDVES